MDFGGDAANSKRKDNLPLELERITKTLPTFSSKQRVITMRSIIPVFIPLFTTGAMGVHVRHDPYAGYETIQDQSDAQILEMQKKITMLTTELEKMKAKIAMLTRHLTMQINVKTQWMKAHEIAQQELKAKEHEVDRLRLDLGLCISDLNDPEPLVAPPVGVPIIPVGVPIIPGDQDPRQNQGRAKGALPPTGGRPHEHRGGHGGDHRY